MAEHINFEGRVKSISIFHGEVGVDTIFVYNGHVYIVLN
jgi:hypothetical protein